MQNGKKKKKKPTMCFHMYKILCVVFSSKDTPYHWYKAEAATFKANMEIVKWKNSQQKRNKNEKTFWKSSFRQYRSFWQLLAWYL